MSTYLTLQGKTLEELPEIPTNLVVGAGVAKALLSWQNNNITITGTTLIPQLWNEDNDIWTDVTTLASTATSYTFTNLSEVSHRLRIAVYVTGTSRYYPSIPVSVSPMESPTYIFTASTYNVEISGGFTTMDYVVVGGGGGAGSGYAYDYNASAGGGGGAGGVLTGTTAITGGFYNFIIGAGGGAGANGSNSYISGATLLITAIGGGSGGGATNAPTAGAAGGSGGGGGAYGSTNRNGGSGTTGQGHFGSGSFVATDSYTYALFAGGGGGVLDTYSRNQNGQTSVPPPSGQTFSGGTGVVDFITNTRTVGAGGTGGKVSSTPATYATNGTNASPNTGNGGNGGHANSWGGGTQNHTGGSGGSGIIIVKLY